MVEPDALGTEGSVLISEVSSFQRLKVHKHYVNMAF